MTENNISEGFFSKPLEMVDDLTVIPGKKELIKPPTPKKEYNCNDCGRCSHSKIKVKDEEKSTPTIKNELGEIIEEENIVYKMEPIGGEDALHVQGKGEKGILIIAEDLTEAGLSYGMSMVGQERKLMKSALKEVGLDLENDCYLINSIRGWREGKTKKDLGIARKACARVLKRDIERLKPKFIITLGFSPLSVLIGDKTSITDQWSKFELTQIPDQDFKSFILPTWSTRDFIWMLKKRQSQYKQWKREKEQKGEPTQFYDEALRTDVPLIENTKLRTDEFVLKYRRFLQQLKWIQDNIQTPFPIDDTRDRIELLHKQKDILEAIYYFHTQKNIAVDIEANSLRGYRKEAKILCIGISNLKRTVAYMTDDPVVVKATKELIASTEVKKSCHNNPYEWHMFRNVWDVEMENVLYDSMLLVHGYDHRTGVVSLKHQVYINFGEKGYDGKTKPFFNQLSDIDKDTRYYDKKNDQRINGLEEALERGKLYEQGLLFPLELLGNEGKERAKLIRAENKRRERLYKKGWLLEDEILLYVGGDAHYTAKLIRHILPKMTPREIEAVQFFTQGALSLSHMTQHGIYVNQKVLFDEMKKIEVKISELEAQIMKTDEVKQWDGEEAFSSTSTQQLAHLLFDIMKNPVISKTDKGAPQVNKTVMEKLGTPLCKLILEKKRLEKVKSTYMDGWARALDDASRAHPEFVLWSTTSFRSSSKSPNAQNSPKRDKEMKKLSRIFLEPTPGNVLIEYDYSGAETFSAGAITGCPTMKAYMLDESTCMHADTACFLLNIQDKENLPSYEKEVDGQMVTIDPPEGTFKMLRQITKIFVFGQFYGDYFGNQAVTLWEEFGQMPKDMLEWLELHMIANGLGSIVAFTNRLEEAQNDIWDRFKVYDQWKRDSWKEYVKKGYIDTVTGFRLNSVLDRKQISNLRIQGPSFHHLLHGIILADREFRRLGLKSTFGAQVHDSFLVDLYPPEKEIVDKIITESFLIKAEQLPNLSWCRELPFVMDKDTYEGSWASNASDTRLDRSVYSENYITA